MKIKLALDWKPNPIHSGIYIAQKSLYKKGIDLEIISPLSDNFYETPATMLKQGLAQLAIVPPEEIINNHDYEGSTFEVLSSLLKKGATALATLKSSGLNHPSSFDNKTYPALGIPYEKDLMNAIVKRNGGVGPMIPINSSKSVFYDGFFVGECDIAWLFLPIELQEATAKGIELTIFPLEELGIPYPCAPILISDKDFYNLYRNEIDTVLLEIFNGNQYAYSLPKNAIDILRREPQYDLSNDYKIDFKMQVEVNKYYNLKINRDEVMDEISIYKNFIANL